MLNDSDSAKDREIGFCVKNNKVTMKINGKEDVSLSDKKETEVKKICKTIIEANNRQDKTFTSEEIEDFSQSTLISSYTLLKRPSPVPAWKNARLIAFIAIPVKR